MAFGGLHENKQQGPMAEINVTPMVDVMLVLLVIFIITAPLFTHAVKLELPTADAPTTEQKADTIALSIDAQGKIFWNNEAVERKELEDRLAAAAGSAIPPEVHLRADKSTRYEIIAQVMAAAQARGLNKIGFVTDAHSSPSKP